MLLVSSALMISYRPSKDGRSLIIFPALKYMAAFWVFTALYSLTVKYLLSFMDELHLYTWSSIGNLLTVLPLLAKANMRDIGPWGLQERPLCDRHHSPGGGPRFYRKALATIFA
jgi:hypothetical protein